MVRVGRVIVMLVDIPPGMKYEMGEYGMTRFIIVVVVIAPAFFRKLVFYAAQLC